MQQAAGHGQECVPHHQQLHQDAGQLLRQVSGDRFQCGEGTVPGTSCVMLFFLLLLIKILCFTRVKFSFAKTFPKLKFYVLSFDSRSQLSSKFYGIDFDLA